MLLGRGTRKFLVGQKHMLQSFESHKWKIAVKLVRTDFVYFCTEGLLALTLRESHYWQGRQPLHFCSGALKLVLSTSVLSVATIGAFAGKKALIAFKQFPNKLIHSAWNMCSNNKLVSLTALSHTRLLSSCYDAGMTSVYRVLIFFFVKCHSNFKSSSIGIEQLVPVSPPNSL